MKNILEKLRKFFIVEYVDYDAAWEARERLKQEELIESQEIPVCKYKVGDDLYLVKKVMIWNPADRYPSGEELYIDKYMIVDIEYNSTYIKNSTTIQKKHWCLTLKNELGIEQISCLSLNYNTFDYWYFDNYDVYLEPDLRDDLKKLYDATVNFTAKFKLYRLGTGQYQIYWTSNHPKSNGYEVLGYRQAKPQSECDSHPSHYSSYETVPYVFDDETSARKCIDIAKTKKSHGLLANFYMTDLENAGVIGTLIDTIE